MKMMVFSWRSDNQIGSTLFFFFHSLKAKLKQIDHVEIFWLYLHQILSTTNFKRRAALTTLGYQLPLLRTHVFDIRGTAAQLLSALSRRTVAHQEEEKKDEEEETEEEDTGRSPAPFCSCSSQEKQQKKNS